MSLKIRIQADDFFKAHKTLEESYDTATLAVMTPSVVCLAFSLELYMKDLHFALKGKAPRGHNIAKLYKSLPHKTKKEIFAHSAVK